MKNATLIILGLFLAVFSLFGALYAERACKAQWIYFNSKYGSRSKESLEAITANCSEAYAIYPHNYYFSIYVSERNYYERKASDGPGQDDRLLKAALWCDRGLKQNFHKSQLRLLKTRLLARTSLDDAIVFWEEYVQWHFWEPYNHAVLAEMYAKRGDFSKAAQSLQWLKGTKHYPDAIKKFNKAWEQEKKPPDLR